MSDLGRPKCPTERSTHFESTIAVIIGCLARNCFCSAPLTNLQEKIFSQVCRLVLTRVRWARCTCTSLRGWKSHSVVRVFGNPEIPLEVWCLLGSEQGWKKDSHVEYVQWKTHITINDKCVSRQSANLCKWTSTTCKSILLQSCLIQTCMFSKKNY